MKLFLINFLAALASNLVIVLIICFIYAKHTGHIFPIELKIKYMISKIKAKKEKRKADKESKIQLNHLLDCIKRNEVSYKTYKYTNVYDLSDLIIKAHIRQGTVSAILQKDMYTELKSQYPQLFRLDGLRIFALDKETFIDKDTFILLEGN